MISDGRPGHYRQSEGIVAAMKRRRSVELHRIELRTHFSIPKGFVPKIAKRMAPSIFLRHIHGIDPRKLSKPDIIISAGAMTLGANVALARIWGVPNVFSGSTRGFPLDRFSLVLTPYASVGGPPNVLAGPKPTPFDPDTIPSGRKLQNPNDMRGTRVSILVGGPTEYAEFGSEDWVRLAHLIKALVAELNCRITIVTSPRTPDQAYASLTPLTNREHGTVSLIDFRKEGAGSIEPALDCDVILVTRDSMSMITEAALSRRPVIALEPQHVRPHRDDEAVADLVRSHLLGIFSLREVSAKGLAIAAAALVPLVENHLDRLAEVVDRLVSPVKAALEYPQSRVQFAQLLPTP
jgi:mitochondrial fission protein ELM1